MSLLMGWVVKSDAARLILGAGVPGCQVGLGCASLLSSSLMIFMEGRASLYQDQLFYHSTEYISGDPTRDQ